MKPVTQKTTFGSITIDGRDHYNDVIISLDGVVRKRKKKLSKRVFGTSHIISLAEAEYIYEKEAEKLLIGTGQYDRVRLSPEAQEFFLSNQVEVTSAATPEAIRLWNTIGGKTIGLFHVTC
jgi:hypothetical protein